RPPQPGEPGRLRGGLQPRPAHRRQLTLHRRPGSADLPARHPRGRLRPRGARRCPPGRHRARGGGRTARARPRHRPPLRDGGLRRRADSAQGAGGVEELLGVEEPGDAADPFDVAELGSPASCAAPARVAAPPGSAAAARAAPAVRSPRDRNIASPRHPSIPTAMTTAVTITNEVSVPWLSRVRSTMAAATVIAHTNTPWGHSENGALQERIARCPSRRPATKGQATRNRYSADSGVPCWSRPAETNRTTMSTSPIRAPRERNIAPD